MNTDLDDWEQMDLETMTLPTLVLQKKMEERKLVEESDHILTNELFGLEQTHDQIPTILAKAIIPTKTSKSTKSCQKINEEKQNAKICLQKEKSVKIRQKKAEIQKTREIFGDSSDPNIEYYSSLEDK